MSKTKNHSRVRENRIYIILILALVISLLAGWISYILFGHQLIKDIYEGNSPEILNRLIEKRAVNPLEIYLDIGDKIFFRMCAGLTVGVFSFIFLYSIWSGRAISKKWFLCLIVVLSFCRTGSHIDFKRADNLLVFDDYPKYYFYTTENARLLTGHGTPFGFNHDFQGGIPAVYLRSCFLEFIPFSLFLGEEAGFMAMLIFFIILIPVSLFFLLFELTQNEDIARLVSFISALVLMPWRYFYYGMVPAMVAIPISFLYVFFFLRYIYNERYPLYPLLALSALLAYTHLVIFAISSFFCTAIFIYRIIAQKEIMPEAKKLLPFLLFHLLVCLPLYYNLLNYAHFFTTRWGYFEDAPLLDRINSVISNFRREARLTNILFFSIFFLAVFYQNITEPKKRNLMHKALLLSIIIFAASSLKSIPCMEIFVRRIDATLAPYLAIFNLSLFLLLKTSRKTKIIGIGLLLLLAVSYYSGPRHFYLRTADKVSKIDSRISSFISSGDYVLFENSAHMYPLKHRIGVRYNAEYDRCSPFERGHWLGLLQRDLGVKLFSNIGEDAHPYNNLRHMYITNGLYKGEPLGEKNKEEFIALLKDWGVNKACVWSPTARAFFDKSRDFRLTGDSDKFRCYEAAYRIMPEVRLSASGRGRITRAGPFSFTLRLEGISGKETVTVNKNYFNFWSAYNEKGERLAIRDNNQKISFDVSGNGYVYFRYQKNILLNVLSLLALLFVFFTDILTCGCLRSRRI